MCNTVDLGDAARKPLIHDGRSTAMGHFKLSLFNKLLGFLLLCLVCSGAVAVVLIRGQMTDLAYAQMRVLFESDFRHVRALLQAKAEELPAAGRALPQNEVPKMALELE